MEKLFEAAILRGGYDLNTMLERIDNYNIDGKLPDEARKRLSDLARAGAKTQVDPGDEIGRLWAEVKELARRVSALEGNGTSAGSGQTILDFVQPSGAHNAYYAGALVRYNGKVYECIAPQGFACAWSPDVTPQYWREA